MQAGRLCPHLSEALIAIDRPVSCGEEWNLGIFTTVGADNRVHLPDAAASIPLLFTRLAAIAAPLGLIDEPTAGIELLLSSGEDEGITAISADQIPVRVHQQTTSCIVHGYCRPPCGFTVTDTQRD